MSDIQTYFVESTGLGQARKWNGQASVVVKQPCTLDEWREMAKDDVDTSDSWSPLYRRIDTGELVSSDDAPPGATRLDDSRDMGSAGPDGMCYWVKLPDGIWWCVDGRCSNCPRPDDKSHQCWVRHGDPRACNVTVTTGCVGGGSIQTRAYHGFLRNGVLVPC